MSFLKKLGQLFNSAKNIVTIVHNIAPNVPVVNEVSAMIDIIQNVEVAGQALQLKGSDKLKMATPSMVQVILKTSAIAGKKIANPELLNAGAQKIADGWADVLNSIHEDEVK